MKDLAVKTLTAHVCPLGVKYFRCSGMYCSGRWRLQDWSPGDAQMMSLCSLLSSVLVLNTKGTLSESAARLQKASVFLPNETEKTARCSAHWRWFAALLGTCQRSIGIRVLSN